MKQPAEDFGALTARLSQDATESGVPWKLRMIDAGHHSLLLEAIEKDITANGPTPAMLDAHAQVLGDLSAALLDLVRLGAIDPRDLEATG